MGADLYGIPLIIVNMGFREKFGSGPGAQKRDTRDTRILQWTWQHGPMDTRASRADATAESNSVLCSEPPGPIRLKHQLSIKGIMWNVAKPQWSPALAAEKWKLLSGVLKKWHFSFNDLGDRMGSGCWLKGGLVMNTRGQRITTPPQIWSWKDWPGPRSELAGLSWHSWWHHRYQTSPPVGRDMTTM